MFAGSKGGGSSSFKQTPDNLRSNDTFEGVLGLGIGPFKGPTRGLKSIKVDGTAIENETGQQNFQDFIAVLGDGDPLKFPQKVQLKLGAGAAPTQIGLSLPNSNGSNPIWITKTLANTNADFVDLRFIVQQLFRQDAKGIYETTATLEIQMKPVGATTWVNPTLNTPASTYNEQGGSSADQYRNYIPEDYYDGGGDYNPGPSNYAITGKTSSPSVYELRISLPNEGAYANTAWDVRVRLLERESYTGGTDNADQEQRQISWESMAAVYANVLGEHEDWRGVAWLQIYGKASDQLTGVPEITGEYDTKIVSVPATVYNPETRQYTGAIWDGSWAKAFTTDPAWIINDAISDELAGLSLIAPGSYLNKWDALELSKWCSELVSDGDGGLEPRYNLNIAISQPQKAEEFVRFLAGAVGALAWDQGDGEWRVKVDKADAPVDLFTLDNIEDEFIYSHTDVDTRFNDIIGQFKNAAMDYRADAVQLFDNESIALIGRKPTTIALVGCTSRQEALRRIKLRLRATVNENRIVTFTTNRRGRNIEQLSTILIADGDLGDQDKRTTGRTVAVAPDRLSIVVRDPMYVAPGVAYTMRFTVPNPDYTPATTTQPTTGDWTKPTIVLTRNVTNTSGQRGSVTTIYLDEALPASIADNLSVALEATDLPTLPRLFRVTSVMPQDDGERISISAINVDTGKQDASDNVSKQDTVFQDLRGAVPPPEAPDGDVLSIFVNEAGGRKTSLLVASWVRPKSAYVSGFRVRLRLNGGSWSTFTERTQYNTIEIENPQVGEYEVEICSIDRQGSYSLPLYGSVTVDQGFLEDLNTNIEEALDTANATSAQMANLVSDTVLYGADKKTLILANTELNAVWTFYDAQAAAISDSGVAAARTSASTARTNWVSYRDALVPAWNDVDAATTVDPAVFNTKLNDYRYYIDNLRNALRLYAQTKANWSGVVDTGGKPADYATRDLTLYDANGGSYTIAGNNVTKGATVGWQGNFYSKESFTGAAFVSGYTIAADCFLGFSDVQTATTPSGYVECDFGVQRVSNGHWIAIANASGILDLGTGYTDATLWAATYDGLICRLFADGVQVASYATTANRKFYAMGCIYTAGGAITNVQLRPYNNDYAASLAQTDATAALADLTNIASDNMLTKGEKSQLIVLWNQIANEQAGIISQAAALSVSSTSYFTAYNGLASYLSGLFPAWNNMAADTTIVGSTFRGYFDSYYSAKIALLLAIDNANKALANAAQADATTALNQIVSIQSDNILAAGEKPQVIILYNAASNEYTNLVAQATALGVSSTTYASAFTALSTYLGGLSPAWNDTTQNTTIVGSTFRTKFDDYYTAKQALVNAFVTANKTAAAAAGAAASAAQADATLSLGRIENIQSDNVLSRVEKSQIISDWSAVTNEYTGIYTQADALGVPRANYISAVNALSTYLGGLSPAYNDVTQDTTIVGTTFRTYWQTYYSEKIALLLAIDDKNRANAAAAQADATAALADLLKIASDSWLSKGEKADVVNRWTSYNDEWLAIYNQGVALGIATLPATFNSAFGALSTYLAGLSPTWSDTTQDTAIVAATFRAKFNDYLVARQALLNAIDLKASQIANWSGVADTGGKPSDYATADLKLTQVAGGTATMAITGNTITSTATGGYSACVYAQPVYGSVFATMSTAVGGHWVMLALDDENSTYDYTTQSVFCFFNMGNGSVELFVNNVMVASYYPAAALPNSQFTLACDRVNVYAIVNGVVRATYPAPAALTGTAAIYPKFYAFSTGYTYTGLKAGHWTDQTQAKAANDAVAIIASDSVLSKGEKPELISRYNEANNSYSQLVARATAYSVSTTALASAFSALSTYLSGLSPAWNDVTQDTTIVGTTLRTKFSDYYTARGDIIVALDAAAGERSLWGGVTGTGKPADFATKNTTTYSSSAPASPTDGDIWIDTSVTPHTTKLRSSGAWQVAATKNTTTYSASAPSSPTNGDVWVDTSVTPNVFRLRDGGAWVVASNYVTNTNQVTDGANLGGTATWTGVTGAAKPSDYATSDLALLKLVGASVTGNSLAFLSGGGYDAMAYTAQAISGPQIVGVDVNTAASVFTMIALDNDASTSAYAYNDMLIAVHYQYSSGTLNIYNSGTLLYSVSTGGAGGRLEIAYDGQRYSVLVGGAVFYQLPATVTQNIPLWGKWHAYNGGYTYTGLSHRAVPAPVPAITFYDARQEGSGAGYWAWEIRGNLLTAKAASWVGNAYSKEFYAGSAALSASFLPTGGVYTGQNTMVGLSDGREYAASNDYNYLDYCFFNGGGTLYIYESGSSFSTGLSYSGQKLLIIYDGTAVRYYVDGVKVREVATTAGRVFYAGVSASNINTSRILVHSFTAAADQAVPVMAGPLSITFDAEYTGTLKSGQLGRTFNYTLKKGSSDVTTSATWSIVSNTGGTFSVGAATGIVSVSAVTGSTGKFTLRSVYAGVTKDIEVLFSRADDAPPFNTGSGGNPGTSGSASMNANTTSNNYATSPAYSATFTCIAGTAGQVALSATIDELLSSSADGVFAIDGHGTFEWRVVGGTWADAGSDVPNQVGTALNRSGGVVIAQDPGSLTMSYTKTSLTSGTTYEFRLKGIKGTAGASQTMNFSGTVTGVGS